MSRENAMREAADKLIRRASFQAKASGQKTPVAVHDFATAGADAERARVVAWLRAEAEAYTFDLRDLLSDTADAIERGEHWTAPPKEGGRC